MPRNLGNVPQAPIVFLKINSGWNDKGILSKTPGKWRFHEKKYHSPTDMFIFNDKVIITIWNAEPYFAIYIKNPEVAKIYKDYFDLIWNIAKNDKSIAGT